MDATRGGVGAQGGDEKITRITPVRSNSRPVDPFRLRLVLVEPIQESALLEVKCSRALAGCHSARRRKGEKMLLLEWELGAP